MRDIGKLENRIENLEEVILTMLELGTKTTSVTDANGFDRFKTGFIVCDFRDKSLADPRYTTIDISHILLVLLLLMFGLRMQNLLLIQVLILKPQI